jgi:superfamily II DNA helicase RecQ
MYPSVPILALTATATDSVQSDIASILGLRAPERFTASINRPNLHYSVLPKPADAAEATSALIAWIQDNYSAGESGIVYALTR